MKKKVLKGSGGGEQDNVPNINGSSYFLSTYTAPQNVIMALCRIFPSEAHDITYETGLIIHPFH